jgi:type II secretory pathway pseudopilin PulG
MEVVIALTILGMITGTLFAIIQGSVRGASQIEQLQRENDAINRFLDLCRKTFTTLPSTATVKLKLLDQNQDAGQELTISGSPRCFGFGINPISYKDTILGLRPDPAGATDANGLLVQYLCLSREDLIPQSDANGLALRQETTGLSAPDEEGRYWMPLLPDVATLKWRFYQEKDQTWLEEWDDDKWPDLIEVQLVMRDRTTPLRMVYSVPTLILTAGRGTPTTTPTNTTNQTSSQNGQGGGGGNNGGNQGGGNNGGGNNGGGRGGQNGGRGNGGGGNNGGNNGGNQGGGNSGGSTGRQSTTSSVSISVRNNVSSGQGGGGR